MDEVAKGVGALIKRVLDGHWPVGHPIRPRRLQEELGIDAKIADTVRHVAIVMGLVKGMPGTGSVVQPPSRWNYRDPDLVRWMLVHSPEDTIRRLLELREAIEPIAALHAARRAPGGTREINRLAERLDELGAVSPAEFTLNRAAFGEADVRFHTLILRAGGNPFFEADATNIELSLQHRLRKAAPSGRGGVIGTASYYPEQPAEVALLMHLGLARALSQELPEAAEAMARGIIVEFNPEHGTAGLRQRLVAAAMQISWGPYQDRVRPELWS